MFRAGGWEHRNSIFHVTKRDGRIIQKCPLNLIKAARKCIVTFLPFLSKQWHPCGLLGCNSSLNLSFKVGFLTYLFQFFEDFQCCFLSASNSWPFGRFTAQNSTIYGIKMRVRCFHNNDWKVETSGRAFKLRAAPPKPQSSGKVMKHLSDWS